MTTPESLYLLLTAAVVAAMLRGVRTVIVDEVHTLARDKRGSHLALSLERLTDVVAADGGRLQRIGLSATQRPLEVVARLLVGVGPRPAGSGGRRLRAPAATSTWPSSCPAPSSRRWPAASSSPTCSTASPGTCGEHRTTLVFVNTRKMAERVAHQLAERLRRDGRSRRRPASARRRCRWRPTTGACRPAGGAGRAAAAGRRPAGPGGHRLARARHRRRARSSWSARSARPGPSGPSSSGSAGPTTTLEGTPAGRLYPLTRDELVECTALLAAVRAGQLDVLRPAGGPARRAGPAARGRGGGGRASGTRTSCSTWSAGPPPTPTSTRAAFDEVVELASWGITTGRGRRGAHLHHDAVNGRLRARRGARLAALTSGGAIPETGDYRVVLDPDGVDRGLGARGLRRRGDRRRHLPARAPTRGGCARWRRAPCGSTDAGDLPPTIPFWLGEAPARTAELSEEVGDLRGWLERAAGRRRRPGRGPAAGAVRAVRVSATRWPTRWWPTWPPAWPPSGPCPPATGIVVERFFDETEGTQLIVHSPYGGRINRALGLALRKRFCVSFDFELQAAADDDTVVLSLGPQHSFPLAQVPEDAAQRHRSRRPDPGRAAPSRCSPPGGGGT